MASLAPFAGAAFKSARREGRREAQEAYAFDGLVALAGAGGGHKPRYDISVRVDLESLLRGYPLGGELCELVGYGTISAQAACDMVASGNGLLRAVLTKGRYVTGVAHPGRRATSHVATALDFVFPRCAAQGCGVRAAYLQTDHRLDWSKSRVTMFDLLDRLCPRHHAMKTNQGWALAQGTGKRPFVAPGDPRHPANSALGRPAPAPPRRRPCRRPCRNSAPHPWPADSHLHRARPAPRGGPAPGAAPRPGPSQGRGPSRPGGPALGAGATRPARRARPTIPDSPASPAWGPLEAQADQRISPGAPARRAGATLRSTVPLSSPAAPAAKAGRPSRSAGFTVRPLRSNPLRSRQRPDPCPTREPAPPASPPHPRARPTREPAPPASPPHPRARPTREPAPPAQPAPPASPPQVPPMSPLRSRSRPWSERACPQPASGAVPCACPRAPAAHDERHSLQ